MPLIARTFPSTLVTASGSAEVRKQVSTGDCAVDGADTFDYRSTCSLFPRFYFAVFSAAAIALLACAIAFLIAVWTQGGSVSTELG